jgi:hypothetical protein
MGRERIAARVKAAVIIAGLAAAAACEDKASTAVTPARSVGDAGIAGDATPARTPAVLFAERVQGPDKRTIYVHILPEVPTAAADRTKAYEFPNVDITVFEEKLYIRDRDANTMTRYRVTEDRKLEVDTLADGKEARFSFQGLGVKSWGFYSVMVSPTRALLPDWSDWRMIVWNPSTMELGETFNMTNVLKDGFPSGGSFPVDPTFFGDKLAFGLYWVDADNLRIHPGMGVALMDPNMNAAPTLVEDTRMTGVRTIFRAASGDLYLVGEQNGTYGLLGQQAGMIPPAGVLRMKAGTTTFDPDYFIDLLKLTGSPLVYGTFVVDDDHLMLQVWDPATDPAPFVAQGADAVWDAEEYVYMLVDLKTRTATRVAAIPKAGAQSVAKFRLDGVLHVQTYNVVSQNVKNATVYRVAADGVQPAFPIPSGDLWDLERIR